MHERKGPIMNTVWMIVLIVVVAAGMAAAFTLLGYAVIKKALEECFLDRFIKAQPGGSRPCNGY